MPVDTQTHPHTQNCAHTHTQTRSWMYTHVAYGVARCTWRVIWWVILNVWPWLFPLPLDSQKPHRCSSFLPRFIWLTLQQLMSQQQARRGATPVHNWSLHTPDISNKHSAVFVENLIRGEECLPPPIWWRFARKHSRCVFIVTVMRCLMWELIPAQCGRVVLRSL